MKKIVCILLLMALLTGLCSCGEKKQAQTENTPTDTTQTEDQKGSGPMKVFFVSNSTCYYFTDELYGMLTAAGYDDVRLVLAYAAGCSIQTHTEWLRQDNAGYQLRVLDKNGLQTMENCSLKMALKYDNWDFIGFDNNARSFASGEVVTSLSFVEPYFGELFGYIKGQFPESRFGWHEVWANEIGYTLAFKMETKEQRTKVYEAKRGVMLAMMERYGLEGVPTGDAWEKVRDLPLFTTPIAGIGVNRFTLNSRVLNNGQFTDDFSHDGDIGGGQYLNACVWFEILTGKSCVGNTYRPVYMFNGKDCSLTEEKISVLQQAAHEAVAEHLG